MWTWVERKVGVEERKVGVRCGGGSVGWPKAVD